METTETARGIYEDTVEGQELSAHELAAQLLEQVEDIRQVIAGDTEGVRDDILDVFEEPEIDMEEVAGQLEDTAKDVRDILGQSGITISELPDGVAGQAQLGGGSIDIDPNSIQSDGDELINKEVAKDIRDHEVEHTKQSASANADGIEVGNQQFDAREIREAAAISVQRNTSFLSAEYQRITASLPMNEGDRELVREGKFIELERRKNGVRQVSQVA
ncbi:hypothetical protein KJ652_00475 [Patescibacteria group bacterium]|nr:hypothetical protein [Patescibacteria group bacterium]MBU1123047.1 hypothetical protein [Patescibacteria group bacterium]MBU1911350.1 hypothetical protein [Patescibacteria group bacterium]